MSYVSLMPYNVDNVYKVKGWNGMISPEGDFYKIYERECIDTGHDLFAEDYVSIKLNQDIYETYKKFQNNRSEFSEIKLAPKDILINLYGFVNYEYFNGKLLLKAPDFRYNGFKITNAQVKMLMQLQKINNDNFEELAQIFEYDDSLDIVKRR